eukprot:TRINITY_DN23431_c0_g1_i1.p1 TRINITY_DN23431_c0_g1~~TRINITY_DN23431_c0_g1_i1.p1  ORF type:complete len:289 (-),score=34.03 TRINITY_DN23431_c0_g1_i1:299-1126(-)
MFCHRAMSLALPRARMRSWLIGQTTSFRPLPRLKRQFSATSANGPMRMAVVLFPGFELLDVAAPVEILGGVPNLFTLMYAAESVGPVASSCMQLSGGSVGPALLATHQLVEGGLVQEGDSGQSTKPDAILVPGGPGVRREVSNEFLVSWMKEAVPSCDAVLTVCTGSWLLGVSGTLDDVPATSNKQALRNGHPQQAAPRVRWQLEARWVEHLQSHKDGRQTLFVTSSGVSAGGDAALALVSRLGDRETACLIAHRVEWSWQEDAAVDPFAKEYGL